MPSRPKNDLLLSGRGLILACSHCARRRSEYLQLLTSYIYSHRVYGYDARLGYTARLFRNPDELVAVKQATTRATFQYHLGKR